MNARLLLTACALLVATLGLAEDHEHAAAPKVDDARFQFLEKLAGQWVTRSATGAMPAGLFEFRVTAGGTAIEEREMIGTPMEMLTVYHLDGGELVGTHYCMIGNQPKVKAAPKVTDNTLAFACNGTPGNAKSHDEHHVHAWSIQLREDGSLLYNAELSENGTVTEEPSVVLVRQETASR
ncbi:MAG TPA: hypothetical protein VD788_04660 [Candidatus Polarisedimenticolaceae bacterium]|nr:hypothetical protein [Candidatus Polarisedimenticolaceae bacterium]